ncbi:lipid A biosynthesis acyltransferase [Hymenobacter roseosalivarius DSM 11622]|uniref:Lipid A biosynthesis acyltransferase n=1 Tax=Hymenobacter roseosalivarius DSM 11622 TaxID=645990 RepID=A0A1W1VA73_9BACT|nr:lysophospholipid acyltransferase family protein [Hymenobacter roseosalivarius]SMB90113.1 lipid A biosynthesis acyltransferase [Hymenobacter roseosalivarius DSM 11622]
MKKAPQKPYPWYYRPLEWMLTGLAHLPLSVLYVVADGFYLVMAYGLRYRKRVVLTNLRNSFPEKTEAQIQHLAKDFYRHFAELLVEILKLGDISAAELKQRVHMPNPEVLEKLLAKGGPVLALGSHAGNWEWIITAGAVWLGPRADGVYKPLANPFFEDFVYRLRTQTGARLVPMRDTLRHLVRHRNEGRVLSMLSDQSPSRADQQYWTQFLHQETAFYTGADKLAAQFHCPVVYVSIRRQRRGYYEMRLVELYDGETSLPKDGHQITEAFARQLERDIQAAPADYLWSHRRWKHKMVKW